MPRTLSATSQERYNKLVGVGAMREEPQSLYPRSLAPTVVKVGDPVQPLDDLAEAVMEGDPEGRRANRALRRRAASTKVSYDMEGHPLLYGKRCCFQAMLVLNRQLDRLHLPYPWTCAECGTLFLIEMRVREERRHV